MGFYDRDSNPINGGVYFAAHGDLNNDDLIDIVVADDGQDRYLLNQGTGGDDLADFISFAYSYSHEGAGGPASDDGFGGNVIVADLNNDGNEDVIVTDVDVDVAGCDRRTHIFRNLGNDPLIMQEQTQGSNCQNFLGNNPLCSTVGISADKLQGTHDVAVFDINGDGWDDMVFGRCSGTEVYMNVPPVAPAGGIPNDDNIPGTGLTVDKSSTEILLSWGASCINGDNDYSVYEGELLHGSTFGGHQGVACSTGGSTAYSRPIINGLGFASSYFLIAPRNDDAIGSLGQSSSSVPRNQGVSSCGFQIVGECE